MRRRPLLVLLHLLVLCQALPAAAPPAPEMGPRRPSALGAAATADAGEDAQVIVKYKALGSMMRALRAGGGQGPQHAATLSARHGLGLSDGRIIDAHSQVLKGGRQLTSAALAARLAADPDVEYAVPDRRRRALALPNDPLFAANAANALAAGQWYLRAPDATLVSATNTAAAWDRTNGSASIVVADVDTGVLTGHPDLASKLLPGYDFINDLATANDGNGRDADPGDPGDWTAAGQCGSGQAAENSSWHGTQTSSIIGAATDNGVGMASVGRNVMLLPVRVLGRCGGFDSDIIAGMLWAGGVSNVPTTNPNPARVINLSLGGTGTCNAAYADAVSRLIANRVVVVAAAGNDKGLAVGEPANCSGVIAVAGVRHTGTKVGFSSLGPEVAIAAPAGNCVNTSGTCLYPILTATNTGTTAPNASGHTYSDSSNYSVGTSFSSPMVAGAVALMLSANPALTPAQVRTMLQNSARAFPARPSGTTVPQCLAPSAATQDECYCTTSTCGAGLLDVAGAVALAAGVASPTAVATASASSVTAGSSITLDGSASSVPGGRTITSYLWTLTAGSGIASFSGATNAATARLVTTGAGTVTARLTITDSTGQQSSATVSVAVNLPAAPVVSILASGSVVPAGNSVTFDGSASSAASGASIASYRWAITSNTALASITSGATGPAATVATTGSGSGAFTITLTVTDNFGQQASASSTVTVTAVQPTAAIASAATSLDVGGSLSLSGTGSTATTGRSISSYQWAITSGSSFAAFSGVTTGSTATLTGGAAGTVVVQLAVTDSAGAQGTRSLTLQVTQPVTPASVGAGGSGGGGAMSGGWLLALGAAVAWLARAGRRGRGVQGD